VYGSPSKRADQPDCANNVAAVAEVVKLQAFPEHQLRVTNTKSALCDTSIKQHSGYLDISDGRHLFYWCVVSEDVYIGKLLILV